jgi:hypothetical protein
MRKPVKKVRLRPRPHGPRGARGRAPPPAAAAAGGRRRSLPPPQGKQGNAALYLTRNQALKKLQLKLSEFR